MNCFLLQKVRYLLSNVSLGKSFWTEVLVYVGHLMNCLSSTTIGGKTLLDIWSDRAAQNYDLLRVYECPAYFSVKDDKLNPRTKKFVILGVKRNLKGYKLWDFENKKIVLSRYITFDKISLLKSTVSLQVERMKTIEGPQRMEVDTTPPSSVDSVSVGISPDVTPGGDRVAVLDAEQVELFAAKRTKKNPQSGL